MKALPAQAEEDNDISVTPLPGGIIEVRLAEEMVMPDGGVTMINDTGRSTQKVGYLKNSKIILLQKLTSYLAKIEKEKFVKAGGNDFLGKQAAKASTKNRLSFECPDADGSSQCWSFGQHAAKHGGTVGLGESKVVNLRLRIMASLTSWDITSGDVNLGVTIPFQNTRQFTEERMKAEKELEEQLIWTFKSKPCAVNVVRKLIAPESYFGERLAWKAKTDENGKPYPCFEGIDRFIADMGFQSFNLIVVDEENNFDPDLSVSLDYGVNLYYKAVAESIGFKNFEHPAFILAVNEASLVESYPFQIPGTMNVIDLSAHCQVAKNNFFQGLKTKLNQFSSNESILQSIRHFTVVGGGAYLFGDQFVDYLSNSEGFVSPLPDLANAISMAMAMGELLG